MAQQDPTPQGNLEILPPNKPHTFAIPKKEINQEQDVQTFLQTHAYTNIMTFILQLNLSMFPRKVPNSAKVETWELNGANIVYSETVLKLRQLLSTLEKIIEEAPPDPGPRRFGNFSFRKWHDIVHERIDHLLDDFLPAGVLGFPAAEPGEEVPTGSRIGNSEDHIDPEPAADRKTKVTAKDELKSYLMGSFGSAQRLDYGTGHELSFLAFLGGLWQLGGFAHTDGGAQERSVVLGVIEPCVPPAPTARPGCHC
jgi:serine/threonine-protein phosphatase 2A activator